MKEIPARSLSYKRMKLNFYLDNAPKRNGGERNIDFLFISHATILRRHRKKRAEYLIAHPLKQTLFPYIEARRCKTLDLFQTSEWKEKLWNTIEHKRGEER